jgi:NAD(P)-dependent dehydrogenase (short-subunit alcohol dehydrogenase family)
VGGIQERHCHFPNTGRVGGQALYQVRLAAEIARPASGSPPVALISGASRGIGAATARELARRGYSLVLAARPVEGLNATAEAASAYGTKSIVVPTDMRDPRAVAQLAQAAVDHFGQVDVLINNAGVVTPLQRFDRLTHEDIETVLATNLFGAITLTRELLPGMIERRAGSVVFVGSVGGRIGLPAAAMYSTTKFGMRGFAFALRREVSRHGVSVILISAGFIRSQLTESLKGIPLRPPELVARTIARTLEHPRPEVVIPRYYRAAIWLDRVFPGAVDRVLRYYTADLLGD